MTNVIEIPIEGMELELGSALELEGSLDLHRHEACHALAMRPGEGPIAPSMACLPEWSLAAALQTLLEQPARH